MVRVNDPNFRPRDNGNIIGAGGVSAVDENTRPPRRLLKRPEQDLFTQLQQVQQQQQQQQQHPFFPMPPGTPVQHSSLPPIQNQQQHPRNQNHHHQKEEQVRPMSIDSVQVDDRRSHSAGRRRDGRGEGRGGGMMVQDTSGFETHMNELAFRLRDNERTQRDVLRHVERLEHEVNDGFRQHEGMLRDEANTRRLLEDHYRFLKVFTGQLKDQLMQMSVQIQAERDTTSKAIDLYKSLQMEQKQVEEKFYREFTRVDHEMQKAVARMESKTEKDLAIMMNEVHQLRAEISGMRNVMDSKFQDVGHTCNNLQKDLAGVDGTTKTLATSINHVKDQIVSTEVRLSSSIQTQESNLTRTSQMLTDMIRSTKQEEADQRVSLQQVLRADIEVLHKQVLDAQETGNVTQKAIQMTLDRLEAEVKRNDEIQEQQRAIYEQQRALEVNVVTSVEARLKSVEKGVAETFVKFQHRQDEMNGEMVKALASVKDNMNLMREEGDRRKEELMAILERAKREIRWETDQIKEELKSDIRRVQKPVIVM